MKHKYMGKELDKMTKNELMEAVISLSRLLEIAHEESVKMLNRLERQNNE